MGSPKSTEDVLLEWVNTFPLASPVKSIADLSDGLVFAQMLEDIDPAYAVRDVVSSTIPSKWLRKKKALESVHRSLLRYLQNNSNYTPAELEAPVGLDAIAENEDSQQTIQFVTLFLVAAVLGTPANQGKYSMRMEPFDQPTIEKIQEIVADKVKSQSKQTGEVSTLEDAPIPSQRNKDIDLALEEQHANIQAELADLKKKHADFITRFERLDYNHEELKARNFAAEEELGKLRSSQDDDQTKMMTQNLQRQLQEANDLIANQEQQLETEQHKNRQRDKELHSLRGGSKRLTELDDEVRELKNENSLLARKANKADHFEKKIESLVSTQKENERLKDTNETLMANMKEWDQVQAELVKIQNSVERYQKMHTNQELHIVELERRIKIYQQDINKQADEIEMLKSQKETDERFYNDAIEDLRAGNTRNPDSPSVSKPLTLEQELEETNDSAPNYLLEMSRLKAEIQLLKSGSGGTTNANLRLELEEAATIKKELEDRHQKLTEDHALTQQQLSAMISNYTGEKDQAINATRKLYVESSNELIAAGHQIRQLQVELSSSNRELLSAKADLAAIDQDELDKLDDLKAVNELVTSSLQNDLLLLESKNKTMMAELEQKKNHIMELILSNNRLLNDLALLKENSLGIKDENLGQAQVQMTFEEDEKNKKNLEDLKQVRLENEVTKPSKISFKRRMWEILKKSHRPYHPALEPLEPVVQSSEMSRQEAERAELARERTALEAGKDPELARERALLGRLDPIWHPLISPRTIPLPQSPIPIHHETNSLIRPPTSKLSTAQTDRSNSRTRGRSLRYKIYSES